jgi:S-adenosylmethionine synthetase
LHWILQKEQYALSKKSPTSLAINTLGYIAINNHLGPTKIKTQFSLDDYKIYQYLSKLTIPEL